jgi:hypothetical protein
MKTLRKIALMGVVLIMASCEEEFLDAQPTATLSAETVAEAAELNPLVGPATLLGIYENLYRRFWAYCYIHEFGYLVVRYGSFR